MFSQYDYDYDEEQSGPPSPEEAAELGWGCLGLVFAVLALIALMVLTCGDGGPRP